jgi:hypothetical protein
LLVALFFAAAALAIKKNQLVLIVEFKLLAEAMEAVG